MKSFIKTIAILLLFWNSNSFSQSSYNHTKDNKKVEILLDSLWINPTSFFNIKDDNWRELCKNLNEVSLDDLNDISERMFGGNNTKIKNEARATEGTLGKLNAKAQKKKTKKFDVKIQNDFRNNKKYPNHKVVLVEGDSWLEYPLFLKDITDNLMGNENLAIYSLASGGDWVANMISSNSYQKEYLKLKPDVFIISGGGNDILDENRLVTFINAEPIKKDDEFLNYYKRYVILRFNDKPVPMCNSSYCPKEYHNYDNKIERLNNEVDQETVTHIINGRRYLNKSFFRWLVSLKLEYKLFLTSLKKLDPEHFKSLKIITQGYDYSIPNSKNHIGVSMLIENGKWIKKPLTEIGITDQQTQQDIIMAMIFDFNEMLIEFGKESSNIYHIDSRGFTNYLEKADHKKHGSYWFDELHPKSIVFKKISESYEAVIFDELKHKHKVVNVIKHHQLKEEY